MFSVCVPDLGEGITIVQLVTWLANEGQFLSEGQDVAEFVTDKAVFCVSAPVSGKLIKQLFVKGDNVSVGDVIAEIE